MCELAKKTFQEIIDNGETVTEFVEAHLLDIVDVDTDGFIMTSVQGKTASKKTPNDGHKAQPTPPEENKFKPIVVAEKTVDGMKHTLQTLANGKTTQYTHIWERNSGTKERFYLGYASTKEQAIQKFEQSIEIRKSYKS